MRHYKIINIMLYFSLIENERRAHSILTLALPLTTRDGASAPRTSSTTEIRLLHAAKFPGHVVLFAALSQCILRRSF